CKFEREWVRFCALFLEFPMVMGVFQVFDETMPEPSISRYHSGPMMAHKHQSTAGCAKRTFSGQTLQKDFRK
ncbi:hypothetical protein BDV98DRAFT_562093, partial [Pterulicium gracile]